MRILFVWTMLIAIAVGAPSPAAADDLADCRSLDIPQRIAGCTRIIEAEKGDTLRKAQAYYARNWAYASKNEFEPAIADLNESIRINPKFAPAYSERGYAHYRRSDFGLARSDLNKAIELKPDFALAFTTRGLVASSLNQSDRAIADHSEAIRLDPNYLNAYGNRANVYYIRRDTEHALTDYRRVIEMPAKNARDRWHQETAKERIARLEKARSVAAGQTSTRSVATGPGAVAASRRIALVIGNSGYVNVGRLANPANDAKAVADMFRRMNFTEVVEVYDLGIAAMTEALKSFGDKAAGADWAVVFFAGHGIEISGTSYLLPVDAKLLRDTHVTEEAVSLDRVQAKVDGATKLGLVILDACRNNPFAAKMTRSAGATRSISGGRGLAPVEPEGNVLIAYSAKHGTVAEDGSGQNSPFTESLIARAEEPNLDVGILFRKVRDDVRAKTQKRQDPFVYGSLGGDMLFLKTATVGQAQR